MIRHGKPPYLECSSRGDLRFSAFYARIKKRGNTIERIYQSSKRFDDGSPGHWTQNKGLKAANQEWCNLLYSELWDEYIEENSDLIPILRAASGLSDRFGQQGHCCQATELWRIRAKYFY